MSMSIGIINISKAQIPVTDAANIAQQVKQVLSWKQQLEAMADQYNQQIEQFNSMTGNRGYGELLNDPQMREYLPEEWQEVYNDIYSEGLEGMSEGAKAIREQYGSTYDCSNYNENTTERRICEAQLSKNYQDADIFTTALNAANQRTEIISSLQSEISRTNDPKSIAELQARIQTEQANLQNEMNKMQIALKLADIQNEIIQQKGQEEIRMKFLK